MHGTTTKKNFIAEVFFKKIKLIMDATKSFSHSAGHPVETGMG
jgi:hypothetical protein